MSAPDIEHPFKGSRLKIGRAAQHVANLAGEIAAFRARVPMYMVPKVHSDPKYLTAELLVAERVPAHWAAIIGDAVHNLRTSLDLLACTIVTLNGQSDEGVYFPFAKSEDELDNMIAKRNVDRAAPEAVALIKSFKPYIGGNSALRGVHDLDIADKHRSILPMIGYISFPGGGMGYDASHPSGPGGNVTSLREWVEPLGMVPGKKLAVGFKLTFPRDGPFADLEMVPTFENLIQDFSRVVDAFETLYLGTIAK
jgi:hypothetical protein